MKRHIELGLVTCLLLLAALLRSWDLWELPPGFTDDELAHIRITESVRQGEVASHYQVGDGHGRTVLYGIANALLTQFTGDGLVGYRLLPLLAGVLSIAAVFALARRLFGGEVALVAAAAMTVNLRAILLARSGTPPSLVPLYVTLTLYLLALAFNLRREIGFHFPATLPYAALALVLGASGYLHYSTLVLGPLAGLFFIHLLATRQPLSRRTWNSMIFLIVLATVIAVPYLIATLREVSLSEPYNAWRARPTSVRNAVDGLLRAIGSVGWRGDPHLAHNLPRAALVGPGIGLLALLGLFRAVRRWRDPRYVLLLLPVVAGLLTDGWVEVQPTFTANLVALPAIFILAGIGLTVLREVLRARDLAQAWHPATALIVVILLANLAALPVRLFDRWRHHPDMTETYHANLGYLADYLDRNPGSEPVSLCVSGFDQPNAVGLTPRQVLGVMMHREGLLIHHSDCGSGLVFANAGAPMRFIFANPADRALMPPELSEWLVDAPEIVVDNLPDGTVLYLDVEQRLRDAGGFWDAMAPVSYMPGEDGTLMPARLPVPLADNLTFAGYDPRVLQNERMPGGDPIVLVTYWRVDGPLPPDLGIFAHLLAYPNPQLAPVAESNVIDVIPAEQHNRDFFVQVSHVWLSKDVPPGDYVLTVGAYTDTAAVLDNHLDVLDPDRNYAPHGDRLVIGAIHVIPRPPEAPPETPPPGPGLGGEGRPFGIGH